MAYSRYRPPSLLAPLGKPPSAAGLWADGRDETPLTESAQRECSAWELDLVTQTFWHTPGFAKLCGLDPDTPTHPYSQFLGMVAEEHRERVAQCFECALTTAGLGFACQILMPNGRNRWVRLRGITLTNHQGEARCLWGIAEDIAEPDQDRHALRRSEAKYRMLFDNMLDGYVCVDMAGRIMEFNRAYQAIIGYTADELLNLNYQQITPEKWLAFEENIVREQIIPHGHSDIYAKEYRRKDGNLVPIELRVILNRNADGQPESMWAIIRDISQRVEAENALRESEGRFRLMLDVAPFAIVLNSLQDQTFLYANPLAAQLAGLSQAEMIGRKVADFYANPEDRQQFLDQLLTNGKLDNVEMRLKNADGQGFWALFSAALIHYRQEQAIIVGMTDITRRKQQELALQESEEWFRSLTKVSPAGIFRTDANGLTVYWNDKLCDMTGLSREQAMGNGWEVCIHPEDRASAVSEWHSCVEEQRPFKVQCRFVHQNGNVIWVKGEADVILDTGGAAIGYVGAMTDISDLKRAEEQVRLVAYQDLLTRLPNRRLLNDRLQQEVAKCRRDGHTLAVCYLDLDGFKALNDRLGYETGDKILLEVASRLVGSVRGGDTVARLGGDEFVILLAGLTDDEECEQILARLLQNTALPYRFNGNLDVLISASIGVTLYPGDNAEPEILLRHADHAMYTAKQAGKNCFHYFDKHLDQRIETKQEMLRRVEHGLNTGQMQLYYQPKVDFKQCRVTGVEALIRWNHPVLGMIEPTKFLPFVEDHDLAIAVGNWVLAEVLRQMEQWLGMGIDLLVSINVFARELHDEGFVERLRRQLAAHPGINPACLRIEILETAALPDLEVTRQVIAECQAMGVGFSLDDFGTGYSSLHYLRNLAVVELKIDQSFVRDMLTDPEALAIVEGIIGLSRAFQRAIVAEGVETQEHIHQLMALGCHQMQGYFISRPLSAEQLLAWINHFKPENFILKRGGGS